MFCDDFFCVVDEIENLVVMWYGISVLVYGYDVIDMDEQVIVCSEVVCFICLYDKVVKINIMNDLDMYFVGMGDLYNVGF